MAVLTYLPLHIERRSTQTGSLDFRGCRAWLVLRRQYSGQVTGSTVSLIVCHELDIVPRVRGQVSDYPLSDGQWGLSVVRPSVRVVSWLDLNGIADHPGCVSIEEPLDFNGRGVHRFDREDLRSHWSDCGWKGEDTSYNVMFTSKNIISK